MNWRDRDRVSDIDDLDDPPIEEPIENTFANAAPNTLFVGSTRTITRIALIPEAVDLEHLGAPRKLPARAVWTSPYEGIKNVDPSCRSPDVEFFGTVSIGIVDDAHYKIAGKRVRARPDGDFTARAAERFLSNDPAITFDDDPEGRATLVDPIPE